MKKCLGLAAALTLFGCGQNSASNLDVIGGTIPKEGTLQSIALLVSEADISIAGAPAVHRQISICTGTLISQTAILSAAHCVNQTLLKTAIEKATGADGKPLNAKVVGNVTFRAAFVPSIADLAAHPELALDVSAVDENENFALLKNPLAVFQKNPGKWDDISILHLREPVTDRPIQKLATADQMKAQASDTTQIRQFAGYGLSDEANPASAGVLKEGNARLGAIGANEFIAGVNDTQHACHGDSGGPIYLDGSDSYQIGIASRINKQMGWADIWGAITGTAKAPSCDLGLVYTRIDPYLSWIKQHVPDLGQ